MCDEHKNCKACQEAYERLLNKRTLINRILDDFQNGRLAGTDK